MVNSQKSANDELKSVLQMLHEITAHGTRLECSRDSLLAIMDVRTLDFNINRMRAHGLLREIRTKSGVF